MSESAETKAPSNGESSGPNPVVILIIAVVLITIGLVGIAIFLVANSETTGPGVQVLRDLLIVVMALELILIGGAITVFFIQIARLVNLINTELYALIDAASDTVNTVKGTAEFLSKNLAEPIISAQGTIRGLGKLVKDVEVVQKAASIIMSSVVTASQEAAAAPEETVEAEKQDNVKSGKAETDVAESKETKKKKDSSTKSSEKGEK